MVVEQFVAIPYVVGGLLGLGMAAVRIHGKRPSDIVSMLMMGFFGSWIYVGIYLAETLTDISDKLDKLK